MHLDWYYTNDDEKVPYKTDADCSGLWADWLWVTCINTLRCRLSFVPVDFNLQRKLATCSDYETRSK